MMWLPLNNGSVNITAKIHARRMSMDNKQIFIHLGDEKNSTFFGSTLSYNWSTKRTRSLINFNVNGCFDE